MPTDDEVTFRKILISSLQTNFGNEGVAISQQTDESIAIIQANQKENGQYTLAYGTFIYDSTNNRLLFSINNGSNVPVFMQIALAVPVPALPPPPP
jgi:hypothetical protein